MFRKGNNGRERKKNRDYEGETVKQTRKSKEIIGPNNSKKSQQSIGVNETCNSQEWLVSKHTSSESLTSKSQESSLPSQKASKSQESLPSQKTSKSQERLASKKSTSSDADCGSEHYLKLGFVKSETDDVITDSTQAQKQHEKEAVEEEITTIETVADNEAQEVEKEAENGDNKVGKVDGPAESEDKQGNNEWYSRNDAEGGQSSDQYKQTTHSMPSKAFMTINSHTKGIVPNMTYMSFMLGCCRSL
jgi:hypothetical protein